MGNCSGYANDGLLVLILILYFSISIKTDILNTERLIGAIYNTTVFSYGIEPKHKQTNH